MRKNEVMELVINHNAAIKTFIDNDLANALGAVNGKVSLDKWFKAQELLKKQKFYERGKLILDVARADGWDVKMNMQSNELLFYGRI